jgi:hypothetical protein
MANQIQSVNFYTLVAEQLFSGLNTISILNLSADAMYIENVDNAQIITLNKNQSVSLSASAGFVLPSLNLSTAGTMNASVITT